ncbi:MAG: metal ABC transporter permease [Leptospiraceae bacterium]|nr:metal ABC transporter permease [Leptospiraceae bacterium]MDW7976868.1 metal ABC transporter permease [Leptospiraceae bacterium]
MIDKILFYLPQILLGGVLGVFVSWMGVFVILRKSVFLGITLAQAITLSVIFVLLLDIHSELLTLILGILFFLPVFVAYERFNLKEAILAAGFVFYGALGQILTSLSGNVQNHIIAAYFGNILLISEKEWSHILIPLIVILFLFVIFYKKILAISFDPLFSKISGIRVSFYEGIYFLILSGILTLSIHFMGSFYTIAHLVIPPTISLLISRNFFFTFLSSTLISVSSTILGFVVSLWEWEITFLDKTLHLPTSSSIIVILSLFLILLLMKPKSHYQ